MCVYYFLEAFDAVKHCGLGERVLFVLLFFLGSSRNAFTDWSHPAKTAWSQTHRSQQIKIEHLWCFLDQVYGEGRVCQKKKNQHISSSPTGLGWGLPDGYDMMRVVGSSSMGDAPTVPVHPSALTQPHPLGYSRTCMWTWFFILEKTFQPIYSSQSIAG